MKNNEKKVKLTEEQGVPLTDEELSQVNAGAEPAHPFMGGSESQL